MKKKWKKEEKIISRRKRDVVTLNAKHFCVDTMNGRIYNWCSHCITRAKKDQIFEVNKTGLLDDRKSINDAVVMEHIIKNGTCCELCKKDQRTWI